jgi:hypothetical protein
MRWLWLVTVAWLGLALAGAGRAAEMSYDPELISVRVSPGEERVVRFTVTLEGEIEGTYYLWFARELLHGDLPEGWVRAREDGGFLDRQRRSASTDLLIRVPQEAAPGTYRGFLLPEARGSHSQADPGGGVFLEVVVDAGRQP